VYAEARERSRATDLARALVEAVESV
jgi:hypothetical protein